MTYIIFLYGIIIGSFLNVCVYRIPQGQSIVAPRSYCPNCGKTLAWWQLIPLVSYIFLRGKCANCRTEISSRYFGVELITGFTYVFLWDTFGYSVDFLFSLVLFSILIVIILTDIDHQIIPDKVVLFGIIVFILLNITTHHLSWLEAFLGFSIGGGLLLLIAVVSNGGMGGGDIKLVAMLGLYVGWQKVLTAVFVAACVGAVFGLIYMLSTGKGRKAAIPFGPFLALGAVVVYLYYSEMVNWYLGLFL